jgi:hypothetical protein
MSIELKIKAKHLALEPAIIRHEEEKLKKQIKYLKLKGEKTESLSNKLNSLQFHRRYYVCNASRATHLARTYLSGKPYVYAEKNRKPDREQIFQGPIIEKTATMIKKYGPDPSADEKVIQAKIRDWSKL